MNSPQDSDLIGCDHLVKELGRSRALNDELAPWRTYGRLGLVVGGFLLLAQCKGDEIKVSYDKSDVVLHSWEWWGLSKTDTPIVWRENQWMRQDKKGEWYVAVEEPDEGPPD